MAGHRFNLSVAVLLPVLLGTAVVVAVLPVVLAGYWGARENTGRLLRDRSELSIHIVEDHIRFFLDPVRDQVGYVARAVAAGALDPRDPAAMTAFIGGALAATPQVTRISHLRPDHTLLRIDRNDFSASIEPPSQAPKTAEYLAYGRSSPEVRWGKPFWSPALNQPILTLIAPLHAGDAYHGVLVAAIRTIDLSRFLQGLAGEIGQIPFILVGHDRVLAHPQLGTALGEEGYTPEEPLPSLERAGDPVLAGIWTREQRALTQIAPLNRSRGHWSWVNDRTYAFVYRTLEGYGDRPWTVGIHFPGTDTRRERWIVRGILIFGAVSLVGSVIVASIVGRRLSRPILGLAAAARAVESLDFDRLRDLPRGRVSEINEAADAFERMARGLRWFETYLPRTLVRRLIAAGETEPRSELRQVTVLFTDLQGYTRYAKSQSAIDIVGFLNGLFARIGPVIEAYGGTIDKYTGDGLMAFWGAPDDRPDQAEAACLTARDLARAVTAFNRERRDKGLGACPMRVGIHTGPAVVGNLGFKGKLDYTMVGNAVNLAQRIQGHGRTLIGDADVIVLVSEATAAAASGAVRCLPLNDGREIGLTGESVRLFRLVLDGDGTAPEESEHGRAKNAV
jgi:class 3 adenylate cyclase